MENQQTCGQNIFSELLYRLSLISAFNVPSIFSLLERENLESVTQHLFGFSGPVMGNPRVSESLWEIKKVGMVLGVHQHVYLYLMSYGYVNTLWILWPPCGGRCSHHLTETCLTLPKGAEP